MTLTTVVKERIAQGEEAAAGTYIPLVGNKDEAIKLWEAYLSIQDEKYTPDEEPDELTEEQYQSYVRRIHDAVRSTDRAYDAFQTDIEGNTITQQDKQGNTIKTQTGMMKFLDSIRMFELQLIAGKLVTTIHNVQAGKLAIPAWPVLAGLGLHKYQNFPDRMEAVIETLTLWKACCKDLFYTEMTWDKRLAMQPKEEGNKKAANANLNLERKIAKMEAKKLKEENQKRQAAALGTDEEDNDNQNDASNEAAPAPSKSAPAPKKKQRTKRGEFITISARGRLSKKATAESSAEPAANADDATQPVDLLAQAPIDTDGANETIMPAASVPVNSDGSAQPTASPTPAVNNNGGSTQPFSGTAFKPINADRSHQRTPSSIPTLNNTGGYNQPAESTASAYNNSGSLEQRAPSTPSATMKTATSKQTNDFFVGPAMIDHGPATQAALAAGSMVQGRFEDTSKFAGPLGKPTAQYGNQVPLKPGQYLLPQQPQQAQSPGQDLPPQYDSPDDHKTVRQGWLPPFLQGSAQGGSRRGFDPSRGISQRQTQGNQGGVGQSPPHHPFPQHSQDTVVQYGQGNHQRGQTTSSNTPMSGSTHGQIAGSQRNLQFSTQQGHSVQNGQMARFRLSGPHSYVVNNYYQPQVPEVWASEDHTPVGVPFYLDDLKTGDEQDVNFDEWLHDDPDLYLPDDQTVGYRYPIKSGDEQPEGKCQDSQNEAPTTPTTNQRNRSAAPTLVDRDNAPPPYESALAGSRVTARFDSHEAGPQPNRHVAGRQRGQVAGSQHGQMPRNTSTPTAPQANPPSEATRVEAMNTPKVATTATSSVNPPPWQGHLMGMNPDDIQAHMDCSAAALGNPPGNKLGKKGTDPAVPPSMFKKYSDVEYERSDDREVGTDEVEERPDVDTETEEFQSSGASQRRVSAAPVEFLQSFRREASSAISISAQISDANQVLAQ